MSNSKVAHVIGIFKLPYNRAANPAPNESDYIITVLPELGITKKEVYLSHIDDPTDNIFQARTRMERAIHAPDKDALTDVLRVCMVEVCEGKKPVTLLGKMAQLQVGDLPCVVMYNDQEKGPECFGPVPPKTLYQLVLDKYKLSGG